MYQPDKKLLKRKPKKKNKDGSFYYHRYFSNPLLYVKENFGAEPDDWQLEKLEQVVYSDRIVVSSGHGIGKSTLFVWIIHWFMATRPFCRIVVTANTKGQLETTTWAELSKWNSRARNRHWFRWTATRFSMEGYNETWFAAAIPWSEHNSEAFAGKHAKYILYIFDEASAIADIIWEVSEGAMTTAGAKWLAFGNPTRNNGMFYECCFGRFRHRWLSSSIDGRTAKYTDKKKIQEWVDDYGIDSDFVRVRVLGLPPKLSGDGYIPRQYIENAKARKPVFCTDDELRIGVDVARFGGDESVLCARQGAVLHPFKAFRNLETSQLAFHVVEFLLEWDDEIDLVGRDWFILIDDVGVGGGVTDRLRELADAVDAAIETAKYSRDIHQRLKAIDFGRHRIVGVNVGEKPVLNENEFVDLRSELWGEMRSALRDYMSIPNDPQLEIELSTPLYELDALYRVKVESAKDLRKPKRLGYSPDRASAVINTFYPVSCGAIAGATGGIV